MDPADDTAGHARTRLISWSCAAITFRPLRPVPVTGRTSSDQRDSHHRRRRRADADRGGTGRPGAVRGPVRPRRPPCVRLRQPACRQPRRRPRTSRRRCSSRRSPACRSSSGGGAVCGVAIRIASNALTDHWRKTARETGEAAAEVPDVARDGRDRAARHPVPARRAAARPAAARHRAAVRRREEHPRDCGGAEARPKAP